MGRKAPNKQKQTNNLTPLDMYNGLSLVYCIKPEGRIAGPCSAVNNVSGYRCVSDCRSRGREFDPCPGHTFVEIDHELISTVIFLPSADSFKKDCCQLQAKVCARITG